MNNESPTEAALSSLLEAVYSVVRIAPDGRWHFVGDADQLKDAYHRAESHLASVQAGCAPMNSEERPINADIERIVLKGAANVTLRQGNPPRMQVRCSGSVNLSAIKTIADGGSLIIDTEPGAMIHKRGVLFQQITAGGISQQFNGPVGTIISGDRALHAGRLSFQEVDITLPNISSIEVSGAGEVSLEECGQQKLELKVSGAGNIQAAGTVDTLRVELSGAGDIHAYGLDSQHAELRVSGAGAIKATARQSVIARVSGVGKIKIRGMPPKQDINVSGQGKIKFT